MTIERGLRLMGGVAVLTTLALAQWHHPYWLWVTAFVGINLLQSGVTNWCPAVPVLAKAGLRPCNVRRRTGAHDPGTRLTR